MTFRRLFFRTAAVLITGLIAWVWFGIAYLNGWFQDWIYQVMT